MPAGSPPPPRSKRRPPVNSPWPSPTIAQLQALAKFASAAEAIEAYRERTVEPILPKVIGTQEEHRVVLPGDPDYPS